MTCVAPNCLAFLRSGGKKPNMSSMAFILAADGGHRVSKSGTFVANAWGWSLRDAWSLRAIGFFDPARRYSRRILPAANPAGELFKRALNCATSCPAWRLACILRYVFSAFSRACCKFRTFSTELATVAPLLRVSVNQFFIKIARGLKEK